MLCVEQTFDHSLDGIARVMRQTLFKETLERIDQRFGWQAEQYLDELAALPVEEEVELMIVTGDGKGVPLVGLMDGSPSQWDAMHASPDPDVSARAVEILDILHVSQYLWKLPKCFIRIGSGREPWLATDWNALCRVT